MHWIITISHSCVTCVIQKYMFEVYIIRFFMTVMKVEIMSEAALKLQQQYHTFLSICLCYDRIVSWAGALDVAVVGGL